MSSPQDRKDLRGRTSSLIWSEAKTVGQLMELLQEFEPTLPVGFDRDVILIGERRPWRREEVVWRKFLREEGFSPTKLATVITTGKFCQRYAAELKAYMNHPGRLEAEALRVALTREITRACGRSSCLVEGSCRLRDPEVWVNHMQPYLNSKGRAQIEANAIPTPRG